MTSTHLIRLLLDGGTEWLAQGADGRVVSGPQPGWPTSRADRVVVLVPAESVVLLRAPRLARQRRQLEQAIPFAIEEQLAAPIEQMHVAIEDTPQGDDVGVAVVAQATMQSWVTRLREAGIEPDAMFCDGGLLPVANGACVWIEGARALLRHAQGGLFAGRVDELSHWLGLLEAEGRRPTHIRWFGPAVAVPHGIELQREDIASPLRWFATQLAGARTPNLLQGIHSARRGREHAHRIWRWAALLALAALLAGLGSQILEQQQLQNRYQTQRAEMEQLLRAAAPELTRIVDPRAQLAEAMTRAGRRGGAGLLPLLARIAPSLSGSGRYTLDGLEFRGDTLELVVRGPDVATLDGLRETLAAMALQVELTGATPGTGGVEGRLRIRSGGG